METLQRKLRSQIIKIWIELRVIGLAKAFGGLDIILSTTNERIDRVIIQLLVLTEHTCEECGLQCTKLCGFYDNRLCNSCSNKRK